MDSRDIIVLGLVAGGGYLAWRWWKNRPIVDAQQTAAGAAAGNAASSMTESAARTTVFGGGILDRRLLAPPAPRSAQPKLPAPTASAAGVAKLQASAFKPVEAIVSAAVLGPTAAAPSPNNFRFSAVGLIGTTGTQNAGDLPPPGNPSPFTILQTRSVR